MKQQLEYERQMEAMLKKGGHGSSSLDDTFSLSQAQKSDKQQLQLENAVDIKVGEMIFFNLFFLYIYFFFFIYILFIS